MSSFAVDDVFEREGGDELEKLGSFPRLGRGNVENMFHLGTLVIMEN
jgi:hypothetical protein